MRGASATGHDVGLGVGAVRCIMAPRGFHPNCLLKAGKSLLGVWLVTNSASKESNAIGNIA